MIDFIINIVAKSIFRIVIGILAIWLSLGLFYVVYQFIGFIYLNGVNDDIVIILMLSVIAFVVGHILLSIIDKDIRRFERSPC